MRQVRQQLAIAGTFFANLDSMMKGGFISLPSQPRQGEHEEHTQVGRCWGATKYIHFSWLDGDSPGL